MSAPLRHGPAWQAAIAAGVDVAMLERNLALTPTERIEQLQAGIRMLELLRSAPRLIAAERSDDAEDR